MTRHVVVVGAGQAGLSLVDRLRAEGHDGPITLIGAEPHPPYERPPLTKAFLLGELPRRLMVDRDDVLAARRVLENAGPCKIALTDHDQ